MIATVGPWVGSQQPCTQSAGGESGITASQGGYRESPNARASTPASRAQARDCSACRRALLRASRSAFDCAHAEGSHASRRRPATGPTGGLACWSNSTMGRRNPDGMVDTAMVSRTSNMGPFRRRAASEVRNCNNAGVAARQRYSGGPNLTAFKYEALPRVARPPCSFLNFGTHMARVFGLRRLGGQAMIVNVSPCFRGSSS